MITRKISPVIIALLALSAAPGLASEMSLNTSNSANALTVKFVKTDSFKKNSKSAQESLGISTVSKVDNAAVKSKRSQNKVLILGGPEVIPM